MLLGAFTTYILGAQNWFSGGNLQGGLAPDPLRDEVFDPYRTGLIKWDREARLVVWLRRVVSNLGPVGGPSSMGMAIFSSVSANWRGRRGSPNPCLWNSVVESHLAIPRVFDDPTIALRSSCDTTDCDKNIHSLSGPRTAWTRDSQKNSMDFQIVLHKGDIDSKLMLVLHWDDLLGSKQPGATPDRCEKGRHLHTVLKVEFPRWLDCTSSLVMMFTSNVLIEFLNGPKNARTFNAMLGNIEARAHDLLVTRCSQPHVNWGYE